MEERYEIRGKIGQGGLGAVYRGYDIRMSREVAIKRIARSSTDPELQEESTRQLIKEAGALASLQHPNIVTIYDVGTDDDGPYVVMELLTGNPLDELIEKAPLTWPDFRELALQTQEALIAAHELDLIHSDIKPTNLMLSWLPSGKFQVKIVDFGLATLTKSQSRQELEEMEAVFGSIFFMAPEQFERVPLDARSDLYSMGCVYYQALAGVYPFDGKTGQEVMQSHLRHDVKPLQELRADIPMWVCDWVMWQINRLPQDRPETARESLSIFLQNDKKPNPTMSLGKAPTTVAQKRPRLIIPGAEPEANPVTPADPAPLASQAAPVMQIRKTPAAAALEPTDSAGHAEVHPAPEPVAEVSPVPIPEEAAKQITAPQPLTPPEGSKPSVHTSAQELATAEPPPSPVTLAAPAARRVVHAPVMPPQPRRKRKLSNSAKTAIAAILGILVILMAWYLLDRSGKNRQTALYNEMILLAAKGDATEVPVNAQKLELLLNAATNTGVVEARQTVYKALFLAKATDNTDIDTRIAEFATTREMLPDVREVLIRDVLRRRKNPAVVPYLLSYASRSNQDPRSAVSALQAVRFMVGDEQIDKFLEVLVATDNDDVRKAAEETLAEIIGKTSSRTDIAERLAEMYENNINDDVRHSLLRLLGRCAGTKAAALVKAALEGSEQKDQVAAIISLGAWGDDSAFHLLTDFIASTQNEDLRNRSFDSALRFLSNPDTTSKPETVREHWTLLTAEAKTSDEQMKVIRGLVNVDHDWAATLIERYKDSDDDRTSDLAEKALERIQQRKLIRGDGKNEPEAPQEE